MNNLPTLKQNVSHSNNNFQNQILRITVENENGSTVVFEKGMIIKVELTVPSIDIQPPWIQKHPWYLDFEEKPTLILKLDISSVIT